MHPADVGFLLEALPPDERRMDSRNVLRGAMALPTLVLTDPSAAVTAAMTDDTMSFGPHDHAGDAAQAFERYGLVSAPLVDERGKLVGRRWRW